MSIAALVADAIADDFVRPTIDRLSRQLKISFYLNVNLFYENELTNLRICSNCKKYVDDINGEVRIVVSDTAIEGRYKYKMQCVFSEDEKLGGFSGFKTRGAVFIVETDAKNDNYGFVYVHNDRKWSRGLEDVFWERKFQ
jgi:hypothetical protein